MSSLVSILCCATTLPAQDAAVDQTRVYGAALAPADSVQKLLYLDQPQLALHYAQRWALTDPHSGPAQHAVALAALALKQADLAVSAAELSVLLAPEVAAHHVALGRAYFNLAAAGDSPATRVAAGKSREALDRAIALDSMNLEAREYLFTFHLVAPPTTGASRAIARRLAGEMGRIDRVKGTWAELRLAATLGPDAAIRTAVRRALDLAGSPTDSAGLVMATMATTAGSARYPAAREELVAMIFARFPRDPRTRFQRARLWITQSRQLTEAETLLAEYVAAESLPARSPSKSTAQWWLGRVYEVQGRTRDALAAYRVCAVLNPPSPECVRETRRLESLLHQ